MVTPTLHDVITARDQALAQANAKLDEIRDEMDKIDLTIQANGSSTPEQRFSWDELDKSLKAVIEWKRDIYIMSLSQIDKSNEVRNLISELNTANSDLKIVFDNVSQVSDQIKDIGALLQKAAAIVSTLTTILGFL